MSMIIGYEAKRIFHNHSGLGNYGRSLVQDVARNYPEHQLRLYNPAPRSIAFGEGLSNVREVRPPLNNKLFRTLWRQKLVSAQAARDGVQVFHGISHELPGDLRKHHIKSVVTIHDLIFMRYPHLYKWVDRKIYLKKVKLAVKRADKVVAISQQTKHDLMELLKLPSEQIEVIYQPCGEVFSQKLGHETIEKIKLKYQLPGEYMLFVGTLEERKNVKLILEAIAKLQINAVLIGKKTKYWQKLVKDPSLASVWQYIHTPTVKDNADLAALYQGAKLFVYPSLFEGFGIPVLEALQSGVPVITSNRSSLPEAAGKHSRLVDVENADALTQAIADIWHDRQRREEMVEQGYLHAAKFSHQQIAQQWIELYQSLI